ncbi:hypothetical protein Dimus_018245 [Dionaea muscipula]
MALESCRMCGVPWLDASLMFGSHPASADVKHGLTIMVVPTGHARGSSRHAAWLCMMMNMPLNSRIKALRRSDVDGDDNVILIMMYQTTPQELIPVDSDLEVVGMNSAEMEVEVDDNSLLVVGDDGEVYGINDADALIVLVIKTTVENMLENILIKLIWSWLKN